MLSNFAVHLLHFEIIMIGIDHEHSTKIIKWEKISINLTEYIVFNFTKSLVLIFFFTNDFYKKLSSSKKKKIVFLLIQVAILLI